MTEKLDLSDFYITGNLVPEKPVEIEEQEEIASAEETPEDEGQSEEIEEEDNVEEETEEPTVEEEEEEEVSDLDLTPLFELANRDMPVELDISKYDTTDPESLAEFLRESVKQNSNPEFASEEVKKFNDFVKNGGKPEQYLDAMYGQPDFESINLEGNEAAQKEVLRVFLTAEYPNRKPEWIADKIERYENSGVLEDEAKDALTSLIEIQKTEKESLAERQRLAYEEQVAQYEQQVKALEERINKKDDILGQSLTKSEKKELFDFATKHDKNGKTAYEKAMESNPDAGLAVLMLAKYNFDIGAFTKAAKKETIKDLKKNLSRFTSTNAEGGRSSSRASSSSRLNFKEEFGVS